MEHHGGEEYAEQDFQSRAPPPKPGRAVHQASIDKEAIFKELSAEGSSNDCDNTSILKVQVVQSVSVFKLLRRATSP